MYFITFDSDEGGHPGEFSCKLWVQYKQVGNTFL
jgi:hypothetical protein